MLFLCLLNVSSELSCSVPWQNLMTKEIWSLDKIRIKLNICPEPTVHVNYSRHSKSCACFQNCLSFSSSPKILCADVKLEH